LFVIALSRVSAGKIRPFGKVARFLHSPEWFAASHFARAHSEVLMENATKSGYDLHSAVTFFLVGVGVGSVLALVFNPKHKVAFEAINSWRTAA
jgi:hypothetical protein